MTSVIERAVIVRERKKFDCIDSSMVRWPEKLCRKMRGKAGLAQAHVLSPAVFEDSPETPEADAVSFCEEIV